mmetsp:Transcript_44579/g.93285  ORF Transcript_44579/g.93285 Transcript_44579/m.93285 type:complete len:549 (-) Transcript_44579:605-2251(-)
MPSNRTPSAWPCSCSEHPLSSNPPPLGARLSPGVRRRRRVTRPLRRWWSESGVGDEALAALVLLDRDPPSPRLGRPLHGLERVRDPLKRQRGVAGRAGIVAGQAAVEVDLRAQREVRLLQHLLGPARPASTATFRRHRRCGTTTARHVCSSGFCGSGRRAGLGRATGFDSRIAEVPVGGHDVGPRRRVVGLDVDFLVDGAVVALVARVDDGDVVRVALRGALLLRLPLLELCDLLRQVDPPLVEVVAVGVVHGARLVVLPRLLAALLELHLGQRLDHGRHLLLLLHHLLHHRRVVLELLLPVARALPVQAVERGRIGELLARLAHVLPPPLDLCVGEGLVRHLGDLDLLALPCVGDEEGLLDRHLVPVAHLHLVLRGLVAYSEDLAHEVPPLAPARVADVHPHVQPLDEVGEEGLAGVEPELVARHPPLLEVDRRQGAHPVLKPLAPAPLLPVVVVVVVGAVSGVGGVARVGPVLGRVGPGRGLLVVIGGGGGRGRRGRVLLLGAALLRLLLALGLASRFEVLQGRLLLLLLFVVVALVSATPSACIA